MINLYSEPGYKVFDPETYYAYTSDIHNELYLLGTEHLVRNELQRAQVEVIDGQIKLPDAAFFADFEQAIDAFDKADFGSKVYRYAARLRRATLQLDSALDNQKVGQYHAGVAELKAALTEVMSTANFFALYIDPQNLYSNALSTELADHLTAQQIGDLLTQPSTTPFLQVLKLSALKYGAGRAGIYQFLNRAYFLRGFDLNVGWEKLKDIDVFLQQMGCQGEREVVLAQYLKLQQEELSRQAKVRDLRAQAYQHVASPKSLQLALAAIDAEELRHYWQTRALQVIAKLAEYLQLNPSRTSFDELLTTLEGFQ
ncbi:hypothetical protein [Pseudoalteromonas rubra]|uniref:hypothetical protein n=1 Tax=Pseudoalteromonas rubra TaxID=43658 RepID=UPI000F7689E8|nr:hypothetical protein [Pseudoalteromonas rubra]